MIIINKNYEWEYFQENVFDYLVSGRLMTCPCPVTGDPIIHDIDIDCIWDMEENNDLTKVVDHDTITEHLNTLIL